MNSNQDPEPIQVEFNCCQGPPPNIIFAANFGADRGDPSVYTYRLVMIQLVGFWYNLGTEISQQTSRSLSLISVAVTEDAN
jgi:hypothetical protein